MPMKENAVRIFGERANSSVCGFWIKGRVVDKAVSSPKKWELSLVSTSVFYFKDLKILFLRCVCVQVPVAARDIRYLLGL